MPFSIGDLVVPVRPGLGWWRTDITECSAEDIVAIPKETAVHRAALAFVNPPTAYRMLRDFVFLQPDDWIIQNGANSAVGRAVIELCREWRINSINIVRDRKNFEELAKELSELGATVVLKAEELAMHSRYHSRCRLGLNCVGGSTVADMAPFLANSSPIVTYGGMSMKPALMPTAQSIFRDIRLVGFWVSRWYESAPYEAKREMILECLRLVKSSTPIKEYPLEQWENALKEAKEPHRSAKILFSMA